MLMVNFLRGHHFLPTFLVTLTIALCPSTVAEEKANPSQNRQSTSQFTTHTCPKSSQEPFPASYRQIEFKQSWCGTVSKQLRALAPGMSSIVSQTAWSKLWQAYRGREPLPKIDFNREIVIAYVHIDSNALYVSPAIDSAKGDLAVGASFTEVGSSNESCTYMFGKLDRRGFKTINGKPIVTKSRQGF
jgi:hypothetical protein